MSDDIVGQGDPLVVIRLLWGKTPASTRGPKARLALSDVVATAVSLVDKEGLPALTTRRVAEELGISPMSLYTYVPGKAELLDLMVDHIWGEIVVPRGATWREKLTHVATQNWELVLRHPWVLEVATHRPVLGPNELAKYDRELSAVDGIGLDELSMDRALTLVLSFTFGTVRGAARERFVKERTGMSDNEWWAKVAPVLDEVMGGDPDRFPVVARVGPVVGEAIGAHDPMGSFRFGLACILDGLEKVIATQSRSSKSSATRTKSKSPKSPRTKSSKK
jgi:AcrR family transcriptional regulator